MSISPLASTSAATAGPSQARHRQDRVYANGTSAPTPPPRSNGRHASRGREGKARSAPRGSWWKRHASQEAVQEAFRKFGEHCARNQIRVLLIDSLVMTNLFYPALSIYLQQRFPPLHPPAPPSHNTHRYTLAGSKGSVRVPKEHPLSLLSTPWLDSFFPYPPPLLPRLTWEGWWHGGTRPPSVDEEWTLNDVDVDIGDEEVHLLRVGWADVGDVLEDANKEDDYGWTDRDHGIYDFVRSTAEAWEQGRSEEACVRELEPGTHGAVAEPVGPCLILAPDRISPRSLAISDLTRSTGSSMNLASYIPANYPAAAGRIYKSIGVLMRLPKGSSTEFHARWNEAMARGAKEVDAELFVEAKGPPQKQKKGPKGLFYTSPNTTTVSASDDDHPPALNRKNKIPRFILVLYVLFVAILASQVSSATQVHSRYGLAFTGVVQVCCSTIMSYSVSSLLGWNLSTVDGVGSLPLYILPFVVVVVGAEGMSAMTKAVFSIPFSHSMPVRIGLGLRKVGPSILLSSLTDLTILTLVGTMVNLRPVRDFCLFAGLVIITDWFMLHTFFLTVLSIDAQRLELADVLANPDSRSPFALHSSRRPKRSLLRRLTRTRRSKSGSLLIILLSIGAIYYITEARTPSNTASLYGYIPSMSSQHHKSTPFITSASQLAALTPADKLWRSLNPLDLPFVRMTVPRASIMVLPRLGHHMRPADLRNLSLSTSRILLPRLKPLFYLFKVFVLPQAVTAAALYVLLLYLLKDSELLEIERTKLGRVDEPGQDADQENEVTNTRSAAVKSNLSVDILPCVHPLDIDAMAWDEDGTLAVSVAADNGVWLWRFGRPHKFDSGTREQLVPETTPDDVIVCALVRTDLAVVITSSGMVQPWILSDDGPSRAMPSRKLDLEGARVRRVIWMPTATLEDPFSGQEVARSGDAQPKILVITSAGSLMTMSIVDGDIETVSPASLLPPIKAFVSQPTSRGDLTLVRMGIQSVFIDTLHCGCWISRDMTNAQSDRFVCGAASSQLVALARRSGLIEIFDTSGEQLQTLAPSQSLPTNRPPPISHMAVRGPTTTQCPSCTTSPAHSSFILVSTTDHLSVYQLNSSSESACRCSHSGTLPDLSTSPPGQLLPPPSSNRRESSPLASPKPTNVLLPVPPALNDGTPLGSHRSRRPSSIHGPERSASNGTPPPNASSSSMSANVSTDGHSHGNDGMHHRFLGSIPIKSGGKCWRVVGDTVVGLRRKGNGIDEDAWEIWTLDLTAPCDTRSRRLHVNSYRFTDLIRRPSTDEGKDGRSPRNSMQSQRNDRLLALNGRIAFPASTNDLPGADTGGQSGLCPPLAFVEISPCEGTKQGLMVGLGNRIAVISVAQQRKSSPSSTSKSRTDKVLTPPPRSAFDTKKMT